MTRLLCQCGDALRCAAVQHLQGSKSEYPITQVSFMAVPGGSCCKESACSAGDTGSIPGSGRSLGGGNGNSLQYSCLENPMTRGACRATIYEVIESDAPEVNQPTEGVYPFKVSLRVTVHYLIVFS